MVWWDRVSEIWQQAASNKQPCCKQPYSRTEVCNNSEQSAITIILCLALVNLGRKPGQWRARAAMTCNIEICARNNKSGRVRVEGWSSERVLWYMVTVAQ